jgi:glycosidase
MKLAWLFQMTYLGAPMVYYGDEVGMMGGKDPACRGTMIWDSTKQEKDLLDCMKELIALRRDNTVLRRGTFKTLIADSSTGVFAFIRKDGSASALIALNNSRKPQSFSIKLSEREGEVKWIQAWPRTSDGVQIKENNMRMTIPASSGVVLLGRVN